MPHDPADDHERALRAMRGADAARVFKQHDHMKQMPRPGRTPNADAADWSARVAALQVRGHTMRSACAVVARDDGEHTVEAVRAAVARHRKKSGHM